MEFRDLKKQYQVLRGEMDRAVLDAMASGAYIMGPQVRALEQQLAEYVGVKHCLTCANGTDALTLALKAWGIGPGDAVFVPDFTFFSSAEVVPLEGAEPVFGYPFRYFTASVAATAPSAAVTSWRSSLVRLSPATKTPGQIRGRFSD